MKRNTLLITLIFINSMVFSQTKRAFVVAISNYPAQSGWTTLSSAKDKEIVMDLLSSQGFIESNIVSLTDQNATYSGFKKSMNDFIGTLQNGDIIYFHFSGHGQQVMDVSSKNYKTEYLEQDEPDGLDEALVLYNAPMKSDNNYQFDEHLVDDQINHYFNLIQKKIGGSGQLIAVFDACHSGTVSRGENDWVVRGTNKVCAPENYQPLSNTKDASNSDFAFENKAELGKLVCFFGCQSNQVNREVDKAGSLTTFFASSIKELKENATYNNLFSLINERMAIAFQNDQQPDIEGDDLNQKIFSGKLIPQDKFLSCDKLISNKAILRGGSISGLALGDSIGFFSNTTNQIKGETPFFKGEVTTIDALSSEVTLNAKKNDRGEKYRAFVISKSIAPANLQIVLDAGDLNKELKKLLENNKNIQLVEGKAKYVIKKYSPEGEKSKDKIQILAGDGDFAMPLRNMSGIDISNQAGKDSLLMLISLAARSDVFRELEWYDETISANYEVTKLANVKAGMKPIKADNEDINYVSYSKHEGFRFEFNNNNEYQIYLNVISIDPDGSMVWYKQNKIVSKTKPNSINFEWMPPFGLQMIKIIYSKQSLDLSAINEMGKSLATRGNESPLFSIIGNASAGKRSAVDSSSEISIENFTFTIKE